MQLHLQPWTLSQYQNPPQVVIAKKINHKELFYPKDNTDYAYSGGWNYKAIYSLLIGFVFSASTVERRGGSGKMPNDMPKWMASSITKIDLFSKWVGNVVCWITIPLILAMTYEVLARKLFTAPTMWAYDMSRFMYGALFMLGAGYALSKG